MTESTFSPITTMIPILRDFKPILDLNLYGEHMHGERITGSKIGLNLSAGSTYTRVCMVDRPDHDSHANRAELYLF